MGFAAINSAQLNSSLLRYTVDLMRDKGITNNCVHEFERNLGKIIPEPPLGLFPHTSLCVGVQEAESGAKTSFASSGSS